MNLFRITLLTFFCSIPFFFLIGRISRFYNDEFLGEWIRSPQDYPLSYSIFLAVVFSCGAILNWLLGNIKSYSKLIYILLGIFSGSIINIWLFISGFLKFTSYSLGMILFFVIFPILQEWIVIIPTIFLAIAFLLRSILFNDRLDNLKEKILLVFLTIILSSCPGILLLTTSENFELILIIYLAIALLFLFNFLTKKLDDIKEKILLAIVIITLPFLPIIILPLVGCYLGDRLSSENRKKSSLLKRFFLAIPKIGLVILCFIWVMKSDHLPGLIVSPHLRNIWGTTTFNKPLNGYEKAIEDLSNCQSIKNEIGEIKTITLTEGKNYIFDSLFGMGSEGTYLNIQIIGDKKEAFVKACFGSRSGKGCAFAHNKIKKEHRNTAKIVSETDVKTIEVLECL